MAILADPTTDPAFLAYMRGQGIAESDARGAVAQRISALQRALNLRLAGYGPQEMQDESKVGGDYEDRGLFRSGQRLQDQQNVANDYERKRLGDIQSTYDQIAGANQDLANQVAQLRRGTADEALAASQRAATRQQSLTDLGSILGG